MKKGKAGRDVSIGAASGSGITEVTAAYTVLPTDRVLNCTGTGVYTITLCPPSVFPAGQSLFIYKKTTGAVTVATPSGGLFASPSTGANPSFVQDDLAAGDDYKLLFNTGTDWIELKELTT